MRERPGFSVFQQILSGTCPCALCRKSKLLGNLYGFSTLLNLVSPKHKELIHNLISTFLSESPAPLVLGGGDQDFLVKMGVSVEMGSTAFH